MSEHVVSVKVGDILIIDKKHFINKKYPCHSNQWRVCTTGSNYLMECCNCKHLILLSWNTLQRICSYTADNPTQKHKSDSIKKNKSKSKNNKSYKRRKIMPPPLEPVQHSKNNEVGINAIVLSDNYKCINEAHTIDDINTVVRLAKNNGEIIDYNMPAAYCKNCNLYFVLKDDYIQAKSIGVLLCVVKDYTQKHLQKHKGKKTIGKESKIHELGYNVKKNNGYTEQQRQIILANILENTDISKYEIKSNINMNIARHRNQPNYNQSVECWKKDLDFVDGYKLGDLPQVKITSMSIGRR